MVEEIQKKRQTVLDQFQKVQKDYHKAITQRQQLDGQLNENKAVKEELDLLKPGNGVFKLIGPVLVKQDLEEAKENVAKRMEYISAEMKRMEDLIESLNEKKDTHRKELEKLQQMMQPS